MGTEIDDYNSDIVGDCEVVNCEFEINSTGLQQTDDSAMESQTRLRGTPEQFIVLVNFMERYGDLHKYTAGKGDTNRIKGDRLWRHVTNLINSIPGGVVKPLEKWKKVWADMKTKTKKKHFLIKRQASRAGGGPSTRQRLTSLECRVLSILRKSMGIRERDGQEDEVIRPSEQDDQSESEGNVVQMKLEDPLSIPSSPQSPLASPPPSPPAPASSPPSPRECPQPTATAHNSSAASTSPRQRLLILRKNRGLKPYISSNDFLALEQRRLRFEEARDLRLHEREMEHLRLESQRIALAAKQNQLLDRLGTIAERLLDTLQSDYS